MLLDEVRTALRVTSTMTDVEIKALIGAAMSDLTRVGIRRELLIGESLEPLAKYAVIAFCKANYGFDNSESAMYQERYKWAVTALMNSSMNETLYTEVEDESLERDGDPAETDEEVAG